MSSLPVGTEDFDFPSWMGMSTSINNVMTCAGSKVPWEVPCLEMAKLPFLLCTQNWEQLGSVWLMAMQHNSGATRLLAWMSPRPLIQTNEGKPTLDEEPAFFQHNALWTGHFQVPTLKDMVIWVILLSPRSQPCGEVPETPLAGQEISRDGTQAAAHKPSAGCRAHADACLQAGARPKPSAVPGLCVPPLPRKQIAKSHNHRDEQYRNGLRHHSMPICGSWEAASYGAGEAERGEKRSLPPGTRLSCLQKTEMLPSNGLKTLGSVGNNGHLAT